MSNANTASIEGNVILADGTKAPRRISKSRRLDDGTMVGYVSFQGRRVRVQKAKGRRLWTLVEAA